MSVKVILLARGTCGIGFIGLCLNALLPDRLCWQSIYLVYGMVFASLGVTALLAATPALVGRENLMQAGAITMLTVRLGSVISPMIGGLLLATRRSTELRAGGGGVYYLATVVKPSGVATTASRVSIR